MNVIASYHGAGFFFDAKGRFALEPIAFLSKYTMDDTRSKDDTPETEGQAGQEK
jgi:hypothetical protein